MGIEGVACPPHHVKSYNALGQVSSASLTPNLTGYAREPVVSEMSTNQKVGGASPRYFSSLSNVPSQVSGTFTPLHLSRFASEPVFTFETVMSEIRGIAAPPSSRGHLTEPIGSDAIPVL